MRLYLIYFAILAFGLASCNSTKWATAGKYADDLYYNPNDKPLSVSDEYIPVLSDKNLKKENNKDIRNGQSEYLSKNPNYAMEQVTADLNNVQQSYSNLLTNDSISDVDSVLYYNDETGYWVDGFDGSPMDLDYATRLIRFHGPFIGIPYWSPLYTEVVYANPWDWNVYIDNNYAYAFPTYTNPAYWNTGFYMGFSWGMPYSYYSPWYNPWYYPPYPYYPYYPPYYGPGWGYCPPYYGPGYDPDNYYYGPRQGLSSSGRISANRDYNVSGPRSAGITNISRNNAVSSTTTRHITPDNNMVIRKGNISYTRVSRNNQNQSDVTKKTTSSRSRPAATNSNVRTTRRSYSSYSTSRSAKRSTFNRSTYTRPTTTQTRRRSTFTRPSSGKVYSAPRSSSYSPARRASSGRSTISKPTYRTGSSKSSRSSTHSSSYSTGSSRNRSSSFSAPSRSSGRSYSVPSSSSTLRRSGSFRPSGGTTRGGRR